MKKFTRKRESLKAFFVKIDDISNAAMIVGIVDVCSGLSFFLYLPSKATDIKTYILNIKVGRTERQQELLL